MRIPRDITGQDLIKILKPLGYIVNRQTGSHIRLVTTSKGEHHITIPNHKPIKVGTLSAILSEIASQFNKTKEELLKELF